MNKNGAKKIFTQEEHNLLKAIQYHICTKDLAKFACAEFEKEITTEQIRHWRERHRLKSGIDTRFKKGIRSGYTPPKGINPEHLKKTQFKKGNKPHNTKPIGSIRYERGDLPYIKMRQSPTGQTKKDWEPLQRVIYEKAYGKIDRKKQVIIFLDGNTKNIELSNLKCISRYENLRLNKEKLRFKNKEATKAGLKIVQIEEQINQLSSNS